MSRPAVILGIGQDAAGDDGVGLVVARALSQGGIAARESSDASLLLTLLDQGERVVVVDAVVGGGEPGDVLRLSADALDLGVTPLSSHGLSVKSALDMARVLSGEDITSRVDIVAIVIERPTSHRNGLSAAVAKAVEGAADLAVRLSRPSP